MAWTVTVLDDDVHGKSRVKSLQLTADAATQSVETGLDVITGISVAKASAVTGFMYINSNASGVATPGQIGCSGFVSGDVLYAMVYGR